MCERVGKGSTVGSPILWRLRKPVASVQAQVIAKRFGVNPGTVQRISRPFEAAAVAVPGRRRRLDQLGREHDDSRERMRPCCCQSA
jgi:hypothetical protein